MGEKCSSCSPRAGKQTYKYIPINICTPPEWKLKEGEVDEVQVTS